MDTETRSECPITRGTWNYTQHPSTEVIMMQWAFDDGEVQIWEVGDPIPWDLFNHIARGGKLAFQNATFDYNVFRFANIGNDFDGSLEPIRDLVDMKLEQLVDTMAWFAASNIPQKLETVCKVLGLPEEYHKAGGMALINKFCKPRKASKKNQDKWWTKETAPEKWAEFLHYGAQDIIAMRMAASYVSELTPYEQNVWRHTYQMNDRGVPVSIQECENIIAIVEQEKDQMNHWAARISGGAFKKVTEKDKVKDWMRDAHGVVLLNAEGKVTLAAEFVDKALESGELPFDVRTVLTLSKAVNQTSVKKFDKMLEIASPDGFIRGMYVYHGAGTGRYASRGGLNLQNLKRPVIKDPEAAVGLFALTYAMVKSVFQNLMDAATSCIRSVLKAPAGYDFINEDFSSVENRCANWFAGQWDIVQGYADGLDEYKLLAVDMYKTTYEAVTKDQRQVAKAGVLGGQFGQGYKGFIAFAEGYGVHVDKKESKEIIGAYRGSHAQVQSMWYELGDQAIAAIKSPGTRFACRGRGFLYSDGLFLCAELPSGRVIKWYKPTLSLRPMPPFMKDKAGDMEYEDMIAQGWDEPRMIAQGYMAPRRMRETVMVVTKTSDGHAWFRQPLIGSSIFQSFVQGMARDLLVHGMLNLEAAGYNICLSTHDEAQSLQPIGIGSEEEFDRHFCNLPAWADRLPIEGESWRGERYRK